MIVDRLHELAAHFSHHTEDVVEHQAVVDLLVLTAYCDHRIDQGELDALDAFDADHANWDEGAFSVQQYLPVAVAKVLSALDAPDGSTHLLAEAAGKITTTSLRAEAISACRSLASADGLDSDDVQFLKQLQDALA